MCTDWWSENPKRNPIRDGRIILKCILKDTGCEDVDFIHVAGLHEHSN
jgi:hypothetical protein